MNIPLIYNLRSVKVRWRSNLSAILSIAGVVAVFVAMLSMAKGFQITLIESGSPNNAIVRRGGATSEMDSIITLDQLRVISDAPEVARSPDNQPLVSPETVVIAAFHHKMSGTDALAQVRGVSRLSLQIHDKVKIARGRFFQPGLAELVVGLNAEKIYSGLSLGNQVNLGGRNWTVVGLMDAEGSAFDSEIWGDQIVLSETYKRPVNIFSSVTLRLRNATDFEKLKDKLTSDPRLTVQLENEIEYYRKQSQAVSKMIRVLGYLVASVMAIGAIFGAFNTMYSAITARSKEIATLRALGFGSASVVFSMLFESALISLAGGLAGCLVVLPLNGLTTSTINWQTFSQLAFAFRISPDLVMGGLLFATLMGLAGGLAPSIRAARLPIAMALREL